MPALDSSRVYSGERERARFHADQTRPAFFQGLQLKLMLSQHPEHIPKYHTQAYCPNRSGHSNGAPRLHAYRACETQLLITRIQNATCDRPIRIGWPSSPAGPWPGSMSVTGETTDLFFFARCRWFSFLSRV
jgi:hypothetical protein